MLGQDPWISILFDSRFDWNRFVVPTRGYRTRRVEFVMSGRERENLKIENANERVSIIAIIPIKGRTRL